MTPQARVFGLRSIRSDYVRPAWKPRAFGCEAFYICDLMIFLAGCGFYFRDA